MSPGDLALLILLVIPAALLCAVIDTWREREEFRRWLREGRWRFEKFRH